MKILAIECSATPCSVAIIEDEKIICSSFVNVKLTHSQTLIPMVENSLKSANLTFDDIEGFAVGKGPGSFTGIRIGISAVKGLAAPKKLPCVGVSTLLGIAENFIDRDCIVCAVMDARCNQVYNALFKISDGIITRLCEDRALMCDELKKEIEALAFDGESIIVAGDGAELFYQYVEKLKNVSLADIKERFQNAVGIGRASLNNFKNNETLSSSEILPFYLRLPQAERELKLKKEKRK